MATYAVTGASRGLGLGILKHLLEDDPQHENGSQRSQVVALARAPEKSEALAKLAQQHPGRVVVIPIDVGSEESVRKAAAEVGQKLQGGLDVLINNAGTTEKDLVHPADLPLDEFDSVLRVNVLGPFLVTKHFLPLLKKGSRKLVVNMSSTLGSLTMSQKSLTNKEAAMPYDPTLLAYKSSKAALNMGTVTWAHALQPEGFTVVSINPGWVATDMGEETARQMGGGVKPPLSTDESTSRIVRLVSKLGPEKTGSFLDAEKDGAPIPW